jgi:hypothetical protein
MGKSCNRGGDGFGVGKRGLKGFPGVVLEEMNFCIQIYKNVKRKKCKKNKEFKTQSKNFYSILPAVCSILPAVVPFYQATLFHSTRQRYSIPPGKKFYSILPAFVLFYQPLFYSTRPNYSIPPSGYSILPAFYSCSIPVLFPFYSRSIPIPRYLYSTIPVLTRHDKPTECVPKDI